MTPQLHHYHLSPAVTAFSTTRHGGISQGAYASFNVNGYCGDQQEHVSANRLQLCRQLGIELTRLVIPHQTHQTHVCVVDESFFGLPEEQRQMRLEGIDAVLTNQPHTCIGVSTADCIPILLYDPVHHAAAAIHAGWRGTVARIGQVGVKAMASVYGSEPAQLKAVIGPGIGPDSFEVGDEVWQAFRDARFSMKAISRRYPPMAGEGADKWHIDLWECNRLQLIDAGIPAASIHLAAIDTWQQSSDFFSARRLGIHSGRIFTGIVLQ